MARDSNVWTAVGGLGAAALASMVSFLSTGSGHDRGEPHSNLPMPLDVPPNTDGEGPARQGRSENFADSVGRLFRSVGVQGEVVKERIEALRGIYRLLRAFGMTEQEIAALIAREARVSVERGLRDRTPSTTEVRRLVDALQESVVRAAEDVDERLDLHGDFVRRVREGVQATRTGREDALIALERTVAAAREQTRRILTETGSESGTGTR